MLDWIDDVPPNIKEELKNRYDELSRLEQEQVQMGTAVPQLYGSLSRFVANPSTVSVETYKRMLDTDETIGSGIDFLNLALIARFGDYKHPVLEIQEFVRRSLNQMEGSWHQNLDEMFSADWAGFSVTEEIWKFENDFDGAPAFVPRKLVTYPPLTMVFAVDRHGEVLPDGIYQYQRFHNTFFNSYAYGVGSGELDGFRPDLYASIGDYPYPIRIAADLTYLTVKIPKDKVIHLRSSSTGKFDNPYGRSILRRAYKHWVLKDAFLNMWLIAADRKGTPLVVGYAAPNDTVLQGRNQDGEQKSGEGRADVAMANTFRTIHNSSFIVLPGKKGETYDVEAIQVQGDMNIFKDAVEYFDKAMMRAMLIPPMILSGEGGGFSGNLGSEQSKIFHQIIDGKLKIYKQGILDQFISKIIAYNFPKELWKKHGYGEFALEEYDPEIMEKLANIYRTLTDVGYMSPDVKGDLDHVREKMGIKKEDEKKEQHGDSDIDLVNADLDDDTETDPLTGKPINNDGDPLNGAQVTSMVDVVKSIALGDIPYQTGVKIIMRAFNLSEPEAVDLVGPEAALPEKEDIKGEMPFGGKLPKKKKENEDNDVEKYDI